MEYRTEESCVAKLMEMYQESILKEKVSCIEVIRGAEYDTRWN